MVRRWIRTLLVIAGLVILAASAVVPVRGKAYWIDPISGSTKRQTYMTFGFGMKPVWKSTPVIEPSPLADWLLQEERDATCNWSFVSAGLDTIWGVTVERGCSSAPPIFLLQDGLQDLFIKSSSNEELRHFVDVMRHGTKEKQRAAVEVAAEKALAAMSRGSEPLEKTGGK
jgi:hypothetical protein